MPPKAASKPASKQPKQPKQPKQSKQSKQSKQPKQCKDTEFLNPFTHRCVSKKGKLWVSLAMQSNIHHTFLLSRKDEVKTVDLHLDFFGAKQLNITGRPPRTFDTVQETYEAMSDTVTKMVDAGWTLNMAVYDTIVKDVRRMLDSMFTCANPKRASSQKSAPPPPQCMNDSTLVMMDPIASVPRQRLVQLQDTHCFDVEELVDAILSTGKLTNPLTQVALTKPDVKLVLAKATKVLLKDQVKKLIDLVKQKSDIYVTLKSTPGFAQLVHAILLTGIVCLCDYTQDFAPAQRALGQLGEVMRGFERMDLAFTLTNKPGSVALGGILKSYGSRCIHGVGFALLDIAFRTLVKCPGLLPTLPPEVRQVNAHSFCLVRLSTSDRPYAVYVYEDRLPKGNMMRLCYFLTMDEPPVFRDVFASGGLLTVPDAQQYYKNAPNLYATLNRGFTAIDTRAKALKRISKRIVTTKSTRVYN